MTGPECATPSDLNNALANWLSASDGTHLDSAPLRLDAKVTQDGITLDAKLGNIAGALGITTEGVSAELAVLKANTAPAPGEAPVSNNALSGQSTAEHEQLSIFVGNSFNSHEAEAVFNTNSIIRILSGHYEFDYWETETAPWSIPSDVNAHTTAQREWIVEVVHDDELETRSFIQEARDRVLEEVPANVNEHSDALAVLLQGDMNDHEANVNAHTTLEIDRAIDAISTGGGGTPTDPASIVDPINAHTTSEADRTIDAVDTNAAQLVTELNDTEGAILADVASFRAHVDDRFDAIATPDLAPINSHTTAEANRVISTVNAETNRVGASIIASNDLQTTILTAVQGALAAITLVVGDILDRVTAIALVVAEALGILNTILAWTQAQPAGTKTLQLVAETPWSEFHHFNQPADQYAVELTSWQTNFKDYDLGDTHIIPHLAWFAFKTANGYVRGERLDYSRQCIPVRDIVATGLYLRAKPGTAGVVRAYRWV
jgi:hypothetical protein